MIMTMLPRDMLLNVSTYVGGTSYVSLCVTNKHWNHLLQHSPEMECRYRREVVAHRKERVARFRAQFRALDITIRVEYRGYQVSFLPDPDRVNLDEPPELNDILFDGVTFASIFDLSRLTDTEVAFVKARCDLLGVSLHLGGLGQGPWYVEFGSQTFTESVAAKEELFCQHAPRFLRLFRQHLQLVTEELPRLKLPPRLVSLCCSYSAPELNQRAIDQVKHFSVDALRQLVSRIVALEDEICAINIGFNWFPLGGTDYRPFLHLHPGHTRCRPPLNVDAYVKQVSEEVRAGVERSYTKLLERRARIRAEVAELERAHVKGLARSTTPRRRVIFQRDVTDKLEEARAYAEQIETNIQLDAELRKLWRTVLRPIAGPASLSFLHKHYNESSSSSGSGSDEASAGKKQRLL